MTAHDIRTYLAKGDHDPHRYGLTAEGLREAYARVLERSKTPTERRALADRFAADPWTIEGPQVAMSEVARLVVEASRARNGWKVILRGCAPEPRPRRTA